MSAAGRPDGPRLFAHCRAGFEPEAAADLRRTADAANATIDVDTAAGRAFVVAVPTPNDAQRWPRALESSPPIFVRSLFFGTGPHALFAATTVTGFAGHTRYALRDAAPDWAELAS